MAGLDLALSVTALRVFLGMQGRVVVLIKLLTDGGRHGTKRPY